MKEKFVDKMGREIEIIIGDDEIIATYNDEVIANFSYDITEAYSELYSMNVKGKYQYSGIGSKIIELGEENFPNVVYPKNTWDKNSNHLSNEGFQLLQSCISKGIIPEHKLFEVDEDDDFDEYSNEFDYDLSTESLSNIKNSSTNSDLFNTLKNNNIDTTYENIDDFMNDIMKKK